MTGGGASTLHHMCVDRCELADDRIHVKQCILYSCCAKWLSYSISDAGMCNLHDMLHSVYMICFGCP